MPESLSSAGTEGGMVRHERVGPPGSLPDPIPMEGNLGDLLEHMNCCDECDRARAEVEHLRQEKVALRELLWSHHGHDGLYGDDGEMQCNMHGTPTDFKRAPIEQIQAHLNALRGTRAPVDTRVWT